MDDEPDPAADREFRFAALLLVGLLVIVALCGCATESREQQHLVIVGTMNGEPVRLEVNGNTASLSKTGLDPEAAAAMVRKIMEPMVAELAAKIPGAAAIESMVKATIGPPKPEPFPLAETGTLALGLGWGVREMLRSRFHENDAAEGWAKYQEAMQRGRGAT